MVTSIHVSPFFEPGSLPLSPPALIAQTDLRYKFIQPTVTAQEDIADGIQLLAAASSRSQLRMTTPNHSRSRSKTPDPLFNKVRFSTPFSREGSPATSDSTVSTTTSKSDSPEANAGLIPKPPGEAGRPDSGGYNLRKALGWKNFAQLQKFVVNLLEKSEDIDKTRSYQHQNSEALQEIRDAVQSEFELLAQYSRCWPVSDIMKSYLKNSSTKWRKVQRQKLAEEALTEVKKVKEKKEKRITRKLRRRSTSNI